MKNKKVAIGIVVATVAIIIVAVIISIVLISNTKSTIAVKTNEDGSISVTAEKASENSGGVGYITLTEGQKLEVTTNLTDGSINIEAVPSNEDATEENTVKGNFAKTDTQEYEIPAGEYTVRVTAEKDTTGSMTINAK